MKRDEDTQVAPRPPRDPDSSEADSISSGSDGGSGADGAEVDVSVDMGAVPEAPFETEEEAKERYEKEVEKARL